MNPIRSLVVAVLMAVAPCSAAAPDHELSPQTAVKLINQLIEDRAAQIEIAMIVDGSGQAGPFEATHVRRVVAVHPVAEDGKRVRRMRCYDFHWNEVYGWFAWEKRVERGGDAVWIWSELLGERVVR